MDIFQQIPISDKYTLLMANTAKKITYNYMFLIPQLSLDSFVLKSIVDHMFGSSSPSFLFPSSV